MSHPGILIIKCFVSDLIKYPKCLKILVVWKVKKSYCRPCKKTKQKGLEKAKEALNVKKDASESKIYVNENFNLEPFDAKSVLFEKTSGAILSRNKKSKMVGVGRWKDKQDWPEEVKVLEVVAEMKIFGFHIPANLGQSCEKF